MRGAQDGQEEARDEVEHFFGGASSGGEDGDFASEDGCGEGGAVLRDGECFSEAARGDDHDFGLEVVDLVVGEEGGFVRGEAVAVDGAQGGAREALVELFLVVAAGEVEAVNFVEFEVERGEQRVSVEVGFAGSGGGPGGGVVGVDDGGHRARPAAAHLGGGEGVRERSEEGLRAPDGAAVARGCFFENAHAFRRRRSGSAFRLGGFLSSGRMLSGAGLPSHSDAGWGPAGAKAHADVARVAAAAAQAVRELGGGHRECVYQRAMSHLLFKTHGEAAATEVDVVFQLFDGTRVGSGRADLVFRGTVVELKVAAGWRPQYGQQAERYRRALGLERAAVVVFSAASDSSATYAAAGARTSGPWVESSESESESEDGSNESERLGACI